MELIFDLEKINLFSKDGKERYVIGSVDDGNGVTFQEVGSNVAGVLAFQDSRLSYPRREPSRPARSLAGPLGGPFSSHPGRRDRAFKPPLLCHWKG
jgi:hypothetical protein